MWDFFPCESWSFYLLQDFFPRTFFYKIMYWSKKKVLENKVWNWQAFISRDFFIKGLFSTGLFCAKFQEFYSGNFFARTFWRLSYCKDFFLFIPDLTQKLQLFSVLNSFYTACFVYCKLLYTVSFCVLQAFVYCKLLYRKLYLLQALCTVTFL